MISGALRKALRAWELLLELLAAPSHAPRVVAATLRGASPGLLLGLLPLAPLLRRLGVRTVVDVGANTGQFAEAILEALPGVGLVALEPLPECHARLEKRLAGRAGCHAIRVAASDRSGTARFHRSSFSPSSSLLPMTDEHRSAYPWTAGLAETEVPTARLDDVLAPLDVAGPFLLKLDVQGAERLVLAGAPRTLERCVAAVVEVPFAELYRGQATFEELHDLMRAADFRFAGLLDRGRGGPDGPALEADALFLRRAPGPA